VIAAGPDRAADESARSRLAAYWRARDRFLVIGRGVRPSGDVHEMLAQIGQPLLSVLAISPDFRPAYDPLLRMAQALSDSDTAAARALLLRLSELQPRRSEAAQALLQLQPAAKP
jgi:spermidine synthase